MAADALLAGLEQHGGAEATRHEVLPVELVVRASTARPRATSEAGRTKRSERSR
jgi:DNA-binding LacI/PurR family transcriptional regulator